MADFFKVHKVTKIVIFVTKNVTFWWRGRVDHSHALRGNAA
jgi:hypothetical protein